MAVSPDVVRDLFVTGLRDAHALENQALALINRQLDRLESYPDVAKRLELHKAETDGQIARLDEVLSSLNEGHSAIKDVALSLGGNLAALAHTVAGDEILKNSIASFAFENFEAASYTSLIALAEAGSFTAALPLLKQTLAEELAMAQWLQDNLPKVTKRFVELKSAGAQASH